MKKQFIFFSFLTVLLVLLTVSCQKEYGTITLDAFIQPPTSNDGKVYIDETSSTPYWHNGDLVRVNNETCTISNAQNTSATIAGVTSADSYKAFYPAGIVDDFSGTSVTMTLSATQDYEVDDDGNQCVKVPMGAVSTSTSLQFNNLCSVVRVTVNNTTGSSMPLSSIVLTSSDKSLSGQCTATLSSSDISFNGWVTGRSYSSVQLVGTTSSPMPAIASGQSESFEIVVPRWTTSSTSHETSDITFRINLSDGRYYESTRSGLQLPANSLATATFAVSQLQNPDDNPAYLVPGPTFNGSFTTQQKSSITSIVFDYGNSTVTSGTDLAASGTTQPIYGNISGTTLTISTPASTIYANANCSTMFSGFAYLTSISFGGSNFNTSLTTNMSSMFYGTHLSTVDFSAFNTASVTDMSNMFSSFSGLTYLDLSSFDTRQVLTMESMFKDADGLTQIVFGANFTAERCTNMSSMFSGCMDLRSLNLSTFNTAQVTDMSYMFQGCMSLSSITGITQFNTANVTTMVSMFHMGGPNNSNNLQNDVMRTLDLSNFNTSNVTDMSYMFCGMKGLTSLTLSHEPGSEGYHETRSDANLNNMFAYCKNLSELHIENLNVVSTTPKYNMFLNLGNSSTNRTCSIYCGSSTIAELLRSSSNLGLSSNVTYHFYPASSKN